MPAHASAQDYLKSIVAHLMPASDLKSSGRPVSAPKVALAGPAVPVEKPSDPSNAYDPYQGSFWLCVDLTPN